MPPQVGIGVGYLSGPAWYRERRVGCRNDLLKSGKLILSLEHLIERLPGPVNPQQLGHPWMPGGRFDQSLRLPGRGIRRVLLGRDFSFHCLVLLTYNIFYGEHNPKLRAWLRHGQTVQG